MTLLETDQCWLTGHHFVSHHSKNVTEKSMDRLQGQKLTIHYPKPFLRRSLKGIQTFLISTSEGEKLTVRGRIMPTLPIDDNSKIPLDLTGVDSNVFAILGRAKKASRPCWDESEWLAFYDEAISGDYDNTLRIIMKYFQVQLGDD